MKQSTHQDKRNFAMTDQIENNTCGNILAEAVEDWASRIVAQDEFNISKHDKRYHPHGYSEGDVCKYRKEAPGCEIRKHYSLIGEGKRIPEMEQSLQEDFKIHPLYATGYDDLYPNGGFNDATASWIHEILKPLPRDIHNANIRTLYEVCTDIKSRHPNFRLLNPKVISWEVKEHVEYYRALSELDDRNKKRTNFMAFGDYYSDDRILVPRYHVFRHEIGHNLATQKIAQDWWRWRVTISEENYNEIIKQKFSEIAFAEEEEAIAEAFAIYSSPVYSQGYLPIGIERIMEAMLNPQGDNPTMDINDTPREGIHPLNDAYSFVVDFWGKEPKDVIRWFDNAVMNYVYFDTHLARGRYILKQYGLPKDWIDAICNAFVDLKWSMSDCQIFIGYYRNTSRTLEEVLKSARRYFYSKED